MLAGCSAFPTQKRFNTVIDLKDRSNAEATIMLIHAMQKEGFSVMQTDIDQFVVRFAHHEYVMEPRMNPNGLSRIVVSRLFLIKREYRQSDVLDTMIMTLNQNLNFAKFAMLPDQKTGQIQSAVTFIDEQVSLDEVVEFMIWMEESLREIKKMVPAEALDMLQSPA